MLRHDIRVAQELFRQQPSRNSRAGKNAQHAHGSEEVQRARQIAQQKADRNQVKKYAERARDAVVRIAPFAVHIADGHFADRSSVPGCQRRNKAVQLAIERNLLQNLPPVGFECRAEIVDIHTAQLGHQPVGAARWNAPQPEIVDAALAPSADDVVTLGDFLQKQRNVGRIVLQVAVHGDDVFAAGVIEAGRQS